MQKFKRMDTVIAPNGTQMSVREYADKFGGREGLALRIYKNDTYQVEWTPQGDKGVWLSIKRIDRELIHDWREMQEIKNELVGRECEGVELYPAESRRVDTANQYHLWCSNDPKFRFPMGFQERVVSGEKEAEDIGAKQRPLKEGAV